MLNLSVDELHERASFENGPSPPAREQVRADSGLSAASSTFHR